MHNDGVADMLKAATPVGARRSNGLFPGCERFSSVFLMAPIKYKFHVPTVPWIIMCSVSTPIL